MFTPRGITTFTIASLNNTRLLGRLVLPTVAPDALEDARIIASIRSNASLGLLRISLRTGDNEHSQPGTMHHPDEASGLLLARILDPEGAVMAAIRATPDEERGKLWGYQFATELYAV